MTAHYIYRCSSCGTDFSADEIESRFHYLCPRCGRLEKNQPLRGVLTIWYDYGQIKKSISRAEFLRLPAGQMWRYPYLWPLKPGRDGSGFEGISTRQLHLLNLPAEVYHLRYQKQAFLALDDTRNPTFSYKDRASILVALKALQTGIGEISAASTGNAGSSLAGICARLGLTARVWVPENIPPAKLLQIQSYGAQVHVVRGDYDAAFDLSLEIGARRGWYNRNTAYNPLTIEGKKSAAFDLFIRTGGELPEMIFVPVGDGVIIAGVFKGLLELRQLGWIERLPRLIAVQAQGSDALVRFLNKGAFTYQPASTLADSISAGAPRNLYLAVEAVKQSNGQAFAVSDRQILTAQQILAREMGILVEPAAAAAFAGYLRLREEKELGRGMKYAVLLTGNGLKDVAALEQWNALPQARSAQEWKAFFQDE